ncbi:hypothetical protein CKA32_006978 [Geitlerinema sp. FC II]|nr:hypothetical protein CKA32_006978 [Geitlerinema sp. FC II]
MSHFPVLLIFVAKPRKFITNCYKFLVRFTRFDGGNWGLNLRKTTVFYCVFLGEQPEIGCVSVLNFIKGGGERGIALL